MSQWKVRHNIIFKKVYGEKGSADNLSAKEWKSNKIAAFLDSFCENHIYNADETGLYYWATPDGSLCYKNVNLNDLKKSMDRITILCCANMSSTDKRKLLVIGTNSKPRCFKGIRNDALPVGYHANKNAWMTSGIFRIIL